MPKTYATSQNATFRSTDSRFREDPRGLGEVVDARPVGHRHALANRSHLCPSASVDEYGQETSLPAAAGPAHHWIK